MIRYILFIFIVLFIKIPARMEKAFNANKIESKEFVINNKKVKRIHLTMKNTKHEYIELTFLNKKEALNCFDEIVNNIENSNIKIIEFTNNFGIQKLCTIEKIKNKDYLIYYRVSFNTCDIARINLDELDDTSDFENYVKANIEGTNGISGLILSYKMKKLRES